MEQPVKKRNEEYYFETVEIFEKKFRKLHGLDTEKVEFHLALCLLCAAMYKEFIKSDDSAMHKLLSELSESDECEIEIHLGELDSTIQFAENHFNDLIIILQEKIDD